MELINKGDNIFGCFMSDPPLNYDATDEDEKSAERKGNVFREYIWGDYGIDHTLKQVINMEYGNDIKLILFQFKLDPFPFQLSSLPDVEKYRAREKSIGVNIIVTDANFFNKDHSGRVHFIKTSVLERVRQLKEKYKNRKKIDTRFDLLERELTKLFEDEPSKLV